MLSNTMANTHLTLYCLVDNEPLFAVKPAPTETVDDLKDLIKAKRSPKFDDIAANNLTLWLAFGSDKTELNNPRARLFMLFPENPDDDTCIIVQRPSPKSNANASCFIHTSRTSLFLCSNLISRLQLYCRSPCTCLCS